MNFNHAKSIFFRNPKEEPNRPGVNSTLYLLRRDTSTCFGINAENGQKLNHQALFPAAMSILAGIDLLAKFVYGDDPGKVGKRFRDYIDAYVLPNKNDVFFEEHSFKSSEILYQLRNSMLHSFGLYSESKINTYKLQLTEDPNIFVVIDYYSEYDNIVLAIVGVIKLWEAFENSISRLQLDISEERFMSMFEKYGKIHFYGH